MNDSGFVLLAAAFSCGCVGDAAQLGTQDPYAVAGEDAGTDGSGQDIPEADGGSDGNAGELGEPDAGDLDQDLLDAYCGCMVANCASGFATIDACLAAAVAVPQTGTDGATSGDTIQCRILHCSSWESDPPARCAAAQGETDCTD